MSKVAFDSAPDADTRPTPDGEPHLRSSEDAMLTRIVSHCQEFRGGNAMRSLGQLALNYSLFGGVIIAMFWFYYNAQWLGLVALSLPAAGLLVRLFIVQHDCGHGAFFKTRWANHFVGWLTSIFTVTPFGFWRDSHNRHHASSGNLTRRGMGGVDTLTVAEFNKLSPFNRWLYKFYRHPLTLLVVGPPVYFLIFQRLPSAGPMPYSEVYLGMKGARIWKSVMLLNATLFVFYGGLGVALGFGAVAAVFLPVIALAGIIGTWLFFVQHQYEDAYWAEQADWNYNKAAIYGSSYYVLPKMLQWFTGNIGLHHIHHLNSLIPNYRLQECYDASSDLRTLPKLTIRESIKCPRLALWDQQRNKLVSFADAQRFADQPGNA